MLRSPGPPNATPYLRRRSLAESVRQRVARAVRWSGLGVTGAGAPPVLGSSLGTIEAPPAWVPPVAATLPGLPELEPPWPAGAPVPLPELLPWRPAPTAG